MCHDGALEEFYQENTHFVLSLNTKLNSLTMEMHNIRRENEKEKAELLTNIEFMQGEVNDLKREAFS